MTLKNFEGVIMKVRVDPDLCQGHTRLTFPDGRKLFLGSSGTGAPRDGSDPTESGRERRSQ